jgi:hypothetical protein
MKRVGCVYSYATGVVGSLGLVVLCIWGASARVGWVSMVVGAERPAPRLGRVP